MGAKAGAQTKGAGAGDDRILSEINRARSAGMNVLIPTRTIEALSEFHSAVLEYVDLDPEPKEGDVYWHPESSKFAIAKQGLQKLSVSAGILWHAAETRRMDNRADRNYVAYQALGGVRKADGTTVWLKAEYELDFEVIEEDLRQQYGKKAGKLKDLKTDDQRQGYIEKSVKRDLLHKRKHKIKLAESGAMNRVVRTLLGLKAGYTKEELQKPFVVIRIVFRPDYTDPQVRHLMLEEGMRSISSIYGGGDVGTPIQVPHTNGPEGEAEPETHAEEEPVGKEEGAWSASDQNEDLEGLSHQKADFLACDKDAQVEILKKLAVRKGYDLTKTKKPLDDFTEEHREQFYDALAEMPDDDIPF